MVLAGTETASGKSVVLKYPQPQTATLDKITQLHREYEILSRIESKYVVEVYDLIECDGLPVIIMEKIDYLPLSNHFKNKHIEILDVLKLAQELTQALDSIHSHGVIYKNLNPGNILIDDNFSNPKLVGFGLASFDNVSQTDEPNGSLEVAEYMSPEQTGRMNLTLDYRSDIYSLGAVLYELAAGVPAFSGDDFLDLIYQHLAKLPEPPSARNANSPATLDNIILKLLVKEPEERYQSTFAVLSDLKKATDLYLVNPAQDTTFIVALDDVPEQLSIPSRLYDRDSEIAQLKSSINRASHQASRPITINGEPGAGKTALLREMTKIVPETGGMLCLHRAGLTNKDIPLSTIAGLLTEISRQLLTRGDLPQLQSHLYETLGNQIGHLVALCPDLQRIIQIDVDKPKTDQPLETKVRIQEAFTNFIAVIAEFTRPLVLALDNAYWIDEGSLELMIYLIKQELSGLLIVMAGRPIQGGIQPDFNPFHVLSDRISITNLDQSTLRLFLSSCTYRSTDEAEDLTQAVYAKTRGNPQAIREFLSELYKSHHLFFDREHREWTWNLEAINRSQPTNNVGMVLSGKIEDLDVNTIEVLKIASCVGDQFDLDTIKRVSGLSFSKTSACLIQAVADGFLLYADLNRKTGYRFAHEQIQNAAYQMLESIERHQIHAQIGRTYLTLADSEDRIFEVVNQLNNSIDENSSESERLQLAKLNLAAGRKAKNSAAFQASFRYLRTSISVQGRSIWSNYNLSLKTHLEAAEAAYYCGDRGQLDSLISATLSKANNPLDKAKAYEIQLRALIADNELDLALDIGHHVLQLLDSKVPKSISGVHLFLWTLRTLAAAKLGKTNEQEMIDPNQLAAMKILMILCQAGYLAGKPITAAFTLKMTELSMRGGLAPESSFAYPLFGAFIIRYFGTINLGYEFGTLALTNLKNNHESLFCRTNAIFYNFVSFWKQHLRASLEPLADAEKIGFELGDIEFAQIAGTTACVNGFIVGQDLNTLNASFTKRNTNALEFNQTPMLTMGSIFQQGVQNLLLNPAQPWVLQDHIYDEHTMVPLHRKERDFTSLANIYILKTQLAFIFREFDAAIDYAEQARRPLAALVSSPLIPLFTTFESLILIQHTWRNRSRRMIKARMRVRKNVAELRKWARHAPMNVGPGYDLVQAELARIQGQHTIAQKHYEQAISGAEKHSHTHLLAIAEELTGRYYEQANQSSLATYYLLRARGTYVRWGALSKVNRLDGEYRELAEQGAQYLRKPWPTSDATEQTHTNQLDLGSVIKASQALSSEIILDTLLEKLMQVVIENAGAHSAGLVLSEGDDLCVEVLSKYNGVTADHKRQRETISNCYDLPASVIQYVARTQEDLVLDDASNEDIFVQDAYISRIKPRSILCFPIMSKASLVGVLYLENLQSKGAFSEDRVAVLKLLASQSAIAIENAKLYQQLNESRNKYLALYENAVEGIFEIDMKGVLLNVNPAAAQLMGYHDSSSINKQRVDFSRFYVEPTELNTFTKRLLKEHRVVGFETRLKRLDDIEIWVAISAHIIFESDVPLKIDGSIIEITERKLRQQAEQATRLAEAATETKSQFLANMSHEIRTPMNAILGYTRLALDTSLNDQQSNYLQTIKNSSDHLLRVVNDILDISKIESGKLELQRTEFDLSDVLNDVYQLFKLEAEEKHLAFNMANQDAGRYLGDPVRLGQILINLVSNAIKFTDQGHVTVELEVLPLHISSHCLNFVVSDSGCGISEEETQTIFEAFTQTHTMKNEEGTGLGLAISKSIVQMMQGHIHVTSDQGLGSKFHFTVILEPLESKPQVVEQLSAHRTQPSNNRLLLVEDNPINRSLALEVLVSNGYEVLGAENGKIALEILANEKVSVVLMDLRMPIMSGNEAVTLIRADQNLQDIPVIALSAGVLQHEIDEALSNGFDRYITKPVDFKQLLQVLAEFSDPPAVEPSNLTPIVEPNVIRGINFSSALHHHDSDEDLLLRLLGDFVTYYEDSADKLESALGSGDYEIAARLMHNLAGLAGTFGAEQLMHVSRQAEKSILQNDELSSETVAEFAHELDNLISAIGEFTDNKKPITRSN